METKVKQRLIGAIVLGALAVIFLPMLLQGPKNDDSVVQNVPLSVPVPESQEFETRELALDLPDAQAGEDGVLGMPDQQEPYDPDQDRPDASGSSTADAVTTVTAGTPPPPLEMPNEVDTVLAPAVDAATGKPDAPAKPTPMATTAGEFVVNVGSFSNLQAAADLVRQLKQAGLNAYAEPVTVSGKSAMRVRSGPFASRTSAEQARLQVNKLLGVNSLVMNLEDESPVPAPTATKSTSAAPGFAVQVGAFRQEPEAKALVARAKAAGFNAFHQSVNTDQGVLFRVRLGPEADREKAEALLQKARRNLGLPGMIVVYP